MNRLMKTIATTVLASFPLALSSLGWAHGTAPHSHDVSSQSAGVQGSGVRGSGVQASDMQTRAVHQKPGANISIVTPHYMNSEMGAKQTVTVTFSVAEPQGTLQLRVKPSDGLQIVSETQSWEFALPSPQVSVTLDYFVNSQTSEELMFFATTFGETSPQTRVMGVAILPEGASPFEARQQKAGAASPYKKLPVRETISTQ